MRRIRAASAALVLAFLGSASVVPVRAAAANALDRYHAIPATGAFLSAFPLSPGADVPSRVFDTDNFGTPVPILTARAVVLRLEVETHSDEGVVTAHPCSRAQDPATDGVLRITAAESRSANEAIVPVEQGRFCLGTTLHSDALVITADVIGYVDSDAGGASWVDLPDQTLADVTAPRSAEPPVTVLRPDFTALGVPADATAVALRLAGSAPVGGAVSVAYGACGTTAGAVGGRGASVVVTVVWVPLPDAQCLVVNVVPNSHARLRLAGYYRVGSTPSPLGPPQIRFRPTHAPLFTPVTPRRLFDTRDGGDRLPADVTYELDVSSLGVPATAVALNVTVTDPVGPGFVTVWPCSSSRPLASNLNYVAGLTVANAVIVSTGFDERVCFASHAAAHIVTDLAGWYRFDTGAGYLPMLPQRALDTRATGAPVVAGEPRSLDLGPYVAADASAVVLNVTATDPLTPGFVTVYPCGTAAPLASNLNVNRGDTVANLVTVALPPDHHVCFNTNMTTDLIADVSGSYTPSSNAGFVDIPPTRMFDTRDDGGAPLPSGTEGRYSFPVHMDAWVMNVTAVEPSLPGFVSVYPCGDLPTVSNINYVADQTVPNLAISAPSPGGQVCFHAHGRTHLLADLQGWFTGELFVPAYVPDGSDRG